MYVVDNYDRTSPWEIIARDCLQFNRCIEMTEQLLSPILTESYHDLIHLKRLSVNSLTFINSIRFDNIIMF